MSKKETVLFQAKNFSKELKKKLLIRKTKTDSPNITKTLEEVVKVGLEVLKDK